MKTDPTEFQYLTIPSQIFESFTILISTTRFFVLPLPIGDYEFSSDVYIFGKHIQPPIQSESVKMRVFKI